MTLKLKYLFLLLPLATGLIYFKVNKANVSGRLAKTSEPAGVVSRLSEENQNEALLDSKLSKKDIDHILLKEDESLALKVLDSKQLDKADLVFFIENLAYFDEPAVVDRAKEELTSVLKEGDIGSVVQFLPTVIHFEMDTSENQKLVRSFCRFEQKEEYGFEVLKLLLNRIPRFQKNELRLSSNCNGAA